MKQICGGRLSKPKNQKEKMKKKRQSHLEVCLSEFFRCELQVSATQKGRTDVIPHPDLKKNSKRVLEQLRQPFFVFGYIFTKLLPAIIWYLYINAIC